MTDNFEDFEHTDGEHNHDAGTPPPPSGFRANLTGAWRSQPLFKLFVLMVIVGAVVAVAISLFSGDNGKSSVSMGAPPSLHEAPGGKSTPYLKEQTEMANKERIEQAIQSGGSALPTPIGPASDTSELNPGTIKEDPLNELRSEVENMNKQLQETKQMQAAPAPAAAAPPEPFDDSLAQAMQRQMSQMLESWVPKGTRLVGVYDLEQLLRERRDEAAAQGGSGSSIAGSSTASGAAAGAAGGATPASAGTSAAPPVTAKTLVSAGTVSYAQLLTEANSDVPGPILAQIVSGPLKGARAVGRFQVANGYSDYLVLTFKLADLKGVDYRINAIALDPDTTLGGMATEVDQRYFTRLVLPAAAGFLQGFAQAVGQNNQDVVTNGTTTIVENSSRGIHQGLYSGLGDAATTASQFFQTQANQTQPLVRVAAGTPMGIFFVETVTDTPFTQEQTANNGQNPNGQPVNGMYPGQNPYGQQGYGTVGYGSGYPGAGAGGGGGYSVLYPGAVTGNQNYGATNSGFGVAGGGYSGYPGSSVYYAH
jgi:intracellular multiplication protein IcmE